MDMRNSVQRSFHLLNCTLYVYTELVVHTYFNRTMGCDPCVLHYYSSKCICVFILEGQTCIGRPV